MRTITKHTIARASLAAALLTALPATPIATAQQAAEARPHAELAAHPITNLIGEWRGEGWTLDPTGARHTFEVIERVRWNLAGAALLVEGFGVDSDPDADSQQLSHDAFALITWDDEAEAPTMTARRAGEPFQTHAITLDPDTGDIIWFVQPDRVRFTITIKDDAWTEVGHFSPDGGERWMQFMEMTLTKQPVRLKD